MGTKVISRWQFYLLTINFTLGTTFFTIIQSLIIHGGRVAWLMPLLAVTLAVIIALVWIILYRCYPGKSWAQIPLAACGRPLGIAFSMLYFLYYCIMAGWVLRNLSDFMNTTIMPETPASVFHIMFLLIACYAVAHGAEALARLNQILTPFLFFPFWFVLFLAAVNWDWGRFQPAFQPGIWAKMLEFHALLGFPFMETITLMMFFPLAGQGIGRIFIGALVTAAASLSMTLFMIIGLLGVERASRLTYPIYTVVQEVSIGEIIVNIHSVISVVLLILIFIKLSVLVHGAYETLRQIFHPGTKWPHLLGLTILLSAMAMSIYENPVQKWEWTETYTFVYDLFFALSIPLLLLAITGLKRARPKSGKRGAD